MDKPLRLIPANNGELYIISEGRRYFAARFDGYVKITERTSFVPVLGRLQKGTKAIYASFVVCDNVDYQSEQAFGMIDTGRVYEAFADVKGDRLEFAGLQFEDSDPCSPQVRG